MEGWKWATLGFAAIGLVGIWSLIRMGPPRELPVAKTPPEKQVLPPPSYSEQLSLPAGCVDRGNGAGIQVWCYANILPVRTDPTYKLALCERLAKAAYSEAINFANSKAGSVTVEAYVFPIDRGGDFAPIHVPNLDVNRSTSASISQELRQGLSPSDILKAVEALSVVGCEPD